MSQNCSSPASISNGYLSVQLPYYQNNDKIYYVCNNGYYIVGNPLLTCDGYTGNWTGSVPSCSQTTTKADDTDSEWQWLAILLAILLFAIFALILLILLLKFCFRLCRRRSKNMIDEKGYNNYHYTTEVGCCYACCAMCCLRCCCRRCFDYSHVQPQQNHVTYVNHSKVTTPVNDIPRASPNSIRMTMTTKEKKIAREIVDEWRPHAKPVRNINTSTQ